MYAQEKHTIHRVRYYPWFQAFTRGLKTYPPWIKGDYCRGYQGLGVGGKWGYCLMGTEFRFGMMTDG